jgi:hypothetical protein
MTLHLTTDFGRHALAFDPEAVAAILEWFMVYGKDANMDDRWRQVKINMIREAARVSADIKCVMSKEAASIAARQEGINNGEPGMVERFAVEDEGSTFGGTGVEA